MRGASVSLALLFALAPVLGDAQPTSYGVDHRRSYVLAVVDTAGVLGVLGHEHAVLATDGDAQICYSPDEPDRSSVSFQVPTSSLRIDTQRARDLAGLDDGPSGEDRRDMQEKMLSERFLWADRFETLSFESRAVEANGSGHLRIVGDMTIRGETKRVELPVRIEQKNGSVFMTGSVRVRQTDFGMEPEEIAGVVKVANAVDIRFHVMAVADGEGACG